MEGLFPGARAREAVPPHSQQSRWAPRGFTRTSGSLRPAVLKVILVWKSPESPPAQTPALSERSCSGGGNSPLPWG